MKKVLFSFHSLDVISVSDCDYHKNLGAYGWCNLSDNPCLVGMIDGNECDEFNELKKAHRNEQVELALAERGLSLQEEPPKRSVAEN